MSGRYIYVDCDDDHEDSLLVFMDRDEKKLERKDLGYDDILVSFTPILKKLDQMDFCQRRINLDGFYKSMYQSKITEGDLWGMAYMLDIQIYHVELHPSISDRLKMMVRIHQHFLITIGLGRLSDPPELPSKWIFVWVSLGEDLCYVSKGYSTEKEAKFRLNLFALQQKDGLKMCWTKYQEIGQQEFLKKFGVEIYLTPCLRLADPETSEQFEMMFLTSLSQSDQLLDFVISDREIAKVHRV